MNGSTDPKDKTVLIVDDDESLAGFLRTVMGNEGFQIVTAKHGTDALAKIAEKRPHLIISDLMMPGEGGYEVLRKLQAEGTARIPVIIVTGAKLDPGTVEMIEREANVYAFFPKPVPVHKLVAVAHQALRTNPSAPKRRTSL